MKQSLNQHMEQLKKQPITSIMDNSGCLSIATTPYWFNNSGDKYM